MSQVVIFPDSKISICIARTKLQIISVKKTKGKVNRSFKYGYAYFLSDLSHQKKGKLISFERLDQLLCVRREL